MLVFFVFVSFFVFVFFCVWGFLGVCSFFLCLCYICLCVVFAIAADPLIEKNVSTCCHLWKMWGGIVLGGRQCCKRSACLKGPQPSMCKGPQCLLRPREKFFLLFIWCHQYLLRKTLFPDYSYWYDVTSCGQIGAPTSMEDKPEQCWHDFIPCLVLTVRCNIKASFESLCQQTHCQPCRCCSESLRSHLLAHACHKKE